MRLRLAALVFLSAALILGFSAAVIYELSSIRLRAESGMGHQLSVILDLSGFLLSLNEAENAERGFLLTNHKLDLETYANQSKDVRARLKRLQDLVTSLDLPKEMVDRLARATDQRLNELDRTIVVRRASGLEAAAKAVRENDEQGLTRQIGKQLAQIRSVEEGEFNDAEKLGKWAAKVRTQTLVAFCLLNLGFLWWGYRKICSETQKQHLAMLHMARLQRVGQQCASAATDFEECLEEFLEAAIALTSADKGAVRLESDSETIRLAAQRGFETSQLNLLTVINRQCDCAIAQALRSNKRVIADDVRQLNCPSAVKGLTEAGVVAMQCTPLISSSGRVLGIISTYFSKRHVCSEAELGFMDLLARQAADYLERKQVEAQLQKAYELLTDRAVHLDELVKQRTARLHEMLGDMEALSYSIVHDMRAPLRAMQSFAQLLAEECAPIGVTAENYVQRIRTAASRMDNLIRDGLSFNRIIREELPLTNIDTSALLHGIVDTYPEFQTPGVSVELKGWFPSVHANEAALTQCISNLIGNGIKFVTPGVNAVVQIWAETSGSRVRLFFKDKGIGIRKDAHERIFEIFQRLDLKFEGTGIGLAIVKRAAERMGGRVGLESEPGEGSTFWLDLASAEVFDHESDTVTAAKR